MLASMLGLDRSNKPSTNQDFGGGSPTNCLIEKFLIPIPRLLISNLTASKPCSCARSLKSPSMDGI